MEEETGRGLGASVVSPLIPPPTEIDLEASAAGGDKLQCRFCLSTDGARRDFIAPCKCKGTSKYVHRNCLATWRILKYYLERNLEARERELALAEELVEKAPKEKAKSKMSKAEKIARKKQKVQAFQQSKQKSKSMKNAKRWK